MNCLRPLGSLALLLSAASLPAATIHHVDLNNPAPSSPYTNWPTAATNIQDAIGAADAGDLVLVTNGLYQTGGALAGKSFISNRLAIVKPITVQSVNGPGVTVILGSRSDSRLGIPYVRCAFLTNGATLIGFTVTNSVAPTSSTVQGGAPASLTLGSPRCGAQGAC